MKAFRGDELSDIGMDIVFAARSLGPLMTREDAAIVRDNVGHIRARLAAWHAWYVHVWAERDDQASEDVPF